MNPSLGTSLKEGCVQGGADPAENPTDTEDLREERSSQAAGVAWACTVPTYTVGGALASWSLPCLHTGGDG